LLIVSEETSSGMSASICAWREMALLATGCVVGWPTSRAGACTTRCYLVPPAPQQKSGNEGDQDYRGQRTHEDC
jgi:hypothetical protein